MERNAVRDLRENSSGSVLCFGGGSGAGLRVELDPADGNPKPEPEAEGRSAGCLPSDWPGLKPIPLRQRLTVSSLTFPPQPSLSTDFMILIAALSLPLNFSSAIKLVLNPSSLTSASLSFLLDCDWCARMRS